MLVYEQMLLHFKSKGEFLNTFYLNLLILSGDNHSSLPVSVVYTHYNNDRFHTADFVFFVLDRKQYVLVKIISSLDQSTTCIPLTGIFYEVFKSTDKIYCVHKRTPFNQGVHGCFKNCVDSNLGKTVF